MKYIPLSEAVRPDNIDDFIGQKHILNEGPSLKKQIKSGQFTSTVFWGPPGTGKATLARIICKNLHITFNELSAVNSTLSDVRKIIAKAESEGNSEALFLDEIHRFNKTQQDALLPAIESGKILLLGATTENPSFGIIPALRSRVRILEFTPLNDNEILTGLKRATKYIKQNINETFVLKSEVSELLILRSSGDLRKALNMLENLVYSFMSEDFALINKSSLLSQISKQYVKYDKKSDEHYDHASAFQKSLRGSDPDAAIYWLGKMLEGGEDPRFIARRLVITASEDVGLADSNALLIAKAALDAVSSIGMPEARIILAQAVLYVATAPKSNSVIKSIDKVFDMLKNGKDYPVPEHLRDAHFSGAKAQGRGNGYIYPHNRGAKKIDYLPKELKTENIYVPLTETERKRIVVANSVYKDVYEQISIQERNLVLEWIKKHLSECINTSDISKDTKIDRKKVYKILQKLESENIIEILPKAKISFISSEKDFKD